MHTCLYNTPFVRHRRSFSSALPPALRQHPQLPVASMTREASTAQRSNVWAPVRSSSGAGVVSGQEMTAALKVMPECTHGALLARPGSRARPRSSAPSLSFSAPVGQRCEVQPAFPGGQNEDLFSVLERTISQQRDDLKAHRQCIEHGIEQDMQQLEVKVRSDQAELQNVYTRHREALDEIARLRALTLQQQQQVEEAVAARMDAQVAASDARETAETRQRELVAKLEAAEAELYRLRQRERADSEQAGKMEGLQMALKAAKTQADAAEAAQAENAALLSRLEAASAAVDASWSNLQQERSLRHARDSSALDERSQWSRALRDLKHELAALLGDACAAACGMEEEAEAWMRQQAQAAQRVDDAEHELEEGLKKCRAAMATAAQLQEQVESLQEEAVHRNSAIRAAAEQVDKAETDCQEAQDKLQQALQQVLTVESERDVAAASVERLERELEERCSLAAPAQQALADAEEQSTSIVSHSESTTRTSTRSMRGATERESRKISAALPEGGEVAEGVGVMVTINNKGKNSVSELQTTIKAKEKEVQVITTKLTTATRELARTKDYWKASQSEANNLLKRLRSEQASRQQEQQTQVALITSLQASADVERAKAASAEAAAARAVEEARAERETALVLRSDKEAVSKTAHNAAAMVRSLQDQLEREDARAKAERAAAAAAAEEARKSEMAVQGELERLRRESAAAQAAADSHRQARRDAVDRLETQLSDARKESRGLEARVAAMADEFALRERQLVAQHEARVTHIETEIDGKVERLVESQKRRMDGKERQFRCTVDKLLGADEALESSITCMVCLSIMRNPVTLVPCGHSFCETCAQPGAGTIQCGECGPGAAVTGCVANGALDTLCVKFSHRVHQLTALRKSLAAA